jgi:hypothetical protein
LEKRLCCHRKSRQELAILVKKKSGALSLWQSASKRGDIGIGSAYERRGETPSLMNSAIATTGVGSHAVSSG